MSIELKYSTMGLIFIFIELNNINKLAEREGVSGGTVGSPEKKVV